MPDNSPPQHLALAKLDYFTVIHLLQERTVSQAGSIALSRWQPFSNPVKVMEVQNKITALRELIDQQAEIPLQEFEDLNPVLNRCRISGAYLLPTELAALRWLLKIVHNVQRFLKNRQNYFAHLKPYIEQLQVLPEVLRRINAILDEHDQIRDNASPELKRLRIAQKQCQRKLSQLVDRLINQARQAGYLHEENPTIRDGRFVLPLRVEHKRKIAGIFHGQSATGATVYIEPYEIVEVNNELAELLEAEQHEIEKILRAVTDELRPEFPQISADIEILTELDILNAAARFSKAFDCHPPRIVDNQKGYVLLNARHPVMTLHKTVVPLNFIVPGAKRVVIISGPNAGGKTVAMKTVGLLTMMALSGWHIPAAADSQIPFFQQFLVDIGDQQSIENDLSTFSSHITNLQYFLSVATSESLVLIDELGTGTEPNEGAALSEAILTALAGRKAWTIATTHHHALKEFAEHHPLAVNAAMEFDLHSLEPTYRLQIGLPGTSYAFEIAARLGLAPEVIQQARQLLGADSRNLNNLLERIASLKSELEKQLQAQTRAKATLDRLIKEYEHKLTNLHEQEAQKTSRTIQELEEFVIQSRQLLENTIRNIKEQAASKEAIQAAQRAFKQVQQSIEQKKSKSGSVKQIPTTIPRVGDQVRVAGLTEIGIVTSPLNKNKRCAVNVNGKTVWLPLDQLQVVAAAATEPASAPIKNITVTTEKSPILSLDIRGMRVAEAEEALLKFLDRALLTGVSQVEIIHGYGTGALQKLTQEVLRNFPGIKSFRFQNFDSGGSGATVVDF
jgi:DNA mismatch repair protein MutS2